MRSRSDRRAGVWADALTIVSIVAVGVSVAAVLDRVSTSGEPAPESVAVAAEPPMDSTYSTPDVTFPTTVPGCDVVEPPSPDTATWGQFFTSEDSYDNPHFPWYTGPRSVMMTDAVAAALPDRTDIQFASRRDSLIFQPIPQLTPEPGEPLPPGWASATAELRRGDAIGSVAVSVAAEDTVVPPCVAGEVQERSTSTDGTVTDVNESWYRYGSARTDFRSVIAYAPDGSWVAATASDAQGFQSQSVGDRDIVLTIDELKQIVSLPELRVTAPIPVGTPDPLPGCNSSAYFADGTAIDADTAAELNEVLDGIDVGAELVPDLNTLKPADFDPNVVCAHVVVRDTGADLSVSIRGGAELPKIPSVYDPTYSNRPLTTETLDGGAVLQVEESSSGGARRSVTVTYPSGTQVEVLSRADAPDEPLGVDTLRAIATADGLDIL